MRLGAPTGLVVFGMAFLVYVWCANGVYATDHATTFIQLDYSLWSRHSISLGDVGSLVPNSVDDLVYNGRYYSALAPGTAFLALPFMGVAFVLQGGYSEFGTSLLMAGVFESLAGAFAAFLVYKIARLHFRESTSVFLSFSFAFSTIAWPFATYFFQSDVSAAFVLLAVWFAVRAGRSDGSSQRFWLYCGLATSIAFTVDYVNGVLVPIFAAYLILSQRKDGWRPVRRLPLFLVASFVGFAAIGAYDHVAFGNPFLTTEAAYSQSGTALDSFDFPVYLGVFLNLFTPLRGLFLFAPLTFLGQFGFFDGLSEKGRRGEYALFLAVFWGILLPYSAWHEPLGGLSFGPRFIVPAIPFMILPIGILMEKSGMLLRGLVYCLYGAGVFINGPAALISAITPGDDWGSSPFVDSILPRLSSGELDTFWAGHAGQLWPIFAALIIGSALVLPLWLHRSGAVDERVGSVVDEMRGQKAVQK